MDRSHSLFSHPHAKHDATEIESVPLEIQVIDPAHPLFGNSYPLVNLSTPHGRNWLSVRMPCGSIRIIPHEATNLNRETLSLEELQEAPRISPLLLLRLQQWLQRQMQNKECQDEGAHPKAEETNPEDSNAVGPIDSTAAGADRGRRASDFPSVATDSIPGGGA